MKLKKFARILPIFAVFFLLFCSKISASPDENAWQTIKMGGKNLDVSYQIVECDEIYRYEKKIKKGLFGRIKVKIEKKTDTGTALYVRIPREVYSAPRYRYAHVLQERLAGRKIDKIVFIEMDGYQIYTTSTSEKNGVSAPVLTSMSTAKRSEIVTAVIILGFADVVDKRSKIRYGKTSEQFFIFEINPNATKEERKNIEDDLGGMSYTFAPIRFDWCKGDCSAYRSHDSKGLKEEEVIPFNLDEFVRRLSEAKIKIEKLEIEKQKLGNTRSKKSNEMDEPGIWEKNKKQEIFNRLTKRQQYKVKEMDKAYCEVGGLKLKIRKAESAIRNAKTPSEEYFARQNYKDIKEENLERIGRIEKWLKNEEKNNPVVNDYFNQEGILYHEARKKREEIKNKIDNMEKRIEEIEKEIGELKELQGI